MDNLPRSAWISVWIASLGARGSPSLSAWMVALGARGSPPFERMDGLPRSLGACGCALGHTDGLSLDHRQAARSCGPTCARCCGHMHHRRAQSARATARRRNAKGSNDQRVCIFVPELCCRGFGGVLKTQTIFGPQLFKAVNKVFKSTSWFPWYKSFSLTCKAQRKFHPSIPNFYLKRHLGYFSLRSGTSPRHLG